MSDILDFYRQRELLAYEAWRKCTARDPLLEVRAAEWHRWLTRLTDEQRARSQAMVSRVVRS